MDSNLPENLIALRENAVQELTEAHEAANQLRAIINEPFGTDISVEADHLIIKILRSFTETISILNSGKVADPAKPAGVLMNSARSTPPGIALSEPSQEWTLNTHHFSPVREAVRESRFSEECMFRTSALKNRMVVKRRRKTAIPRTRITPNLLDDGHSWRKFGQKEILGAKFPRCYYRCTFRHDQGCLATKQTQITEDDPSMCLTTYLGEHTCQNQLTAPPQIILDSTTPTESSNSHFSFGSSNSPNDELGYQSYSTSTTIHHPPVIISSYRT